MGSLIELEDSFYDLIAGLGADGDFALGAVWLAYAGPENAQEIVDLCDGADGRSGRLAGRFSFDGDGGGEAFDMLDAWFLELSEELPCV